MWNSNAELVDAVTEQIKTYGDFSAIKFKDFRRDLAKYYRVSESKLKDPEIKEQIVDAIAVAVESLEGNESSISEDEFVDSQDENSEPDSVPEKRKVKTQRPRGSNKQDTYFKKLSKMQKASGIGPIVYRNLPEDPESRVQALSKNLKSAGAVFRGLVPSNKEIADAQAKTNLKKDLEGIDTSNIISSKRRRAPMRLHQVEIDTVMNGSDDGFEDESEFECSQSSTQQHNKVRKSSSNTVSVGQVRNRGQNESDGEEEVCFD